MKLDWSYFEQTLIRPVRRVAKGSMIVLTRPRGFKEFLRSTISMAMKSERCLGLPVHITIEPLNICDQKCPVCETGINKLRRPQGKMALENYQKIIQMIKSHCNTLLFYFMGEPFLHPQSYEMIRYAKDQGIPFISTCTNGNFVDAEKLVASGIDEVHFQIGGMTQKTHETYRIGGDLEKALKNLRETLAERNRVKGKLRVVLGFIVMKHNEHEVEAAKRFAEEIGVDILHVINPRVLNWEQGKVYLPKDKRFWDYDYSLFERGVLRPKLVANNRCNWIYYSTNIYWNGNVVPCCRDPTGKHVMGNVFEQDLAEIWNNDHFRKFRKAIRTDQMSLTICRQCSSYPIPALH